MESPSEPLAPDRPPRLKKGRTVAREAIGHEGCEGQDALLGTRAPRGAGQRRLGLKDQLWWHLTLSSPGGVLVAQPRLGPQESLIHERIAVPRRISSQDAHLTSVYLAQGPTVLPGDSHRVLALLGTAALVHDHYPLRVPHIVIDQLVGDGAHLRLVPEVITHETPQFMEETFDIAVC